MKFRTEYTSRPASLQLHPEKPVVLLGSCFTDNIGQRMQFCRWDATPNPTGTLYNPASIAKILRLACRPECLDQAIKESIAVRESPDIDAPLYVTWLADSKCSTYTREETEARITEKIEALSRSLQAADTLIVTFGTAWIYNLTERPEYTVANCHKFPAACFQRRRMTVEEIVTEWKELLAMLQQTYPGLRIIFTVSPVRHLKDGFEGNSRSKAILQLACEALTDSTDSIGTAGCTDNTDSPGTADSTGSNDRVDYFPAYEIMNDDLRDYRFYASDMVHPSADAIEYIWEKFQDRYLSPASRALLLAGEKETRRLCHRPNRLT